MRVEEELFLVARLDHPFGCCGPGLVVHDRGGLANQDQVGLSPKQAVGGLEPFLDQWVPDEWTKESDESDEKEPKHRILLQWYGSEPTKAGVSVFHGAAHEGGLIFIRGSQSMLFKTDGFVEGVLSKCLCVSRDGFPSSFFL